MKTTSLASWFDMYRDKTDSHQIESLSLEVHANYIHTARVIGLCQSQVKDIKTKSTYSKY